MSSRRPATDAPPDSALPDPVLPDPALPDPALPEPALPEPALPDPALSEPALSDSVLSDSVLSDPAPPDDVLSAGLGVVLSVVVDSGLFDPTPPGLAVLDPGGLAPLDSGNLDTRTTELDADLEAVLDLDGSVIGPLIAPALASLADPTADLAGPGFDPADLVTPAMIEAARRLPAEQRARLAELAGAQYGLCSSGHRRSVRVVNSGRHARTQLTCRTCEPEPT